MDMIQYVDIKNGIDLFVGNKKEFIIRTYGSMYDKDGEINFNSTFITILPYDNDKNFINITKYISEELLNENNTFKF